jgi:hypothetical protein
VSAGAGTAGGYAARFDDLFSHVAQRRGFRQYLTGLLAPRDRIKTLTCLAGAEPVTGAGQPAVQRLQFFVSESCWDPDRVNARRLELLVGGSQTAPHPGGVLVIDDSGDRKDGVATAFTGRQWLGRVGKSDNGIVTVTTLWADERLYYPLFAEPYTPARRLPGGKGDPAFATKWRIAARQAIAAAQAGVVFRAAVADCAHGDIDDLRAQLRQAGLPWVVAVGPCRGTRAYGDQAHTPATLPVRWPGAAPDDPGDWTPSGRRFRDGRTALWWAAEATLGWWAPDGLTRLVVATADPGRLPDKATWYLATHLPRPGGARVAACPAPTSRPGRAGLPLPAAQLGRAKLQADQRRTGVGRLPGPLTDRDPPPPGPGQLRLLLLLGRLVHRSIPHRHQLQPCPREGAPPANPASPPQHLPGPQLAPRATRSAQLADPRDHAHTLVAGLVTSGPTR